jgi:phage/plasmid-associated DNA primase
MGGAGLPEWHYHQAIELTSETYNPSYGLRNAAAAVPPNGEPRPDPEQSGAGVPDLLNSYDPEYVGNGQRFLAMYGNIVRWCPEREKWLVWDSRRWKLDDTEQVRLLAQRVMTEFGIQAAKSNNESLMRFAAGCRRSARITNALRATHPHLTISANELDTHPWLLNFLNGTVDLATGELPKHNREHYITRLIDYAYRQPLRASCFSSSWDAQCGRP